MHPRQGYSNQPGQSIQILATQMQNLQRSFDELFKLTESRTRDIIERQHKHQNDTTETKLFLRTKLGAPDASRLKDIMKQRLSQERNYY